MSLNKKVWILHEVINLKRKHPDLWPDSGSLYSSWSDFVVTNQAATPHGWWVGGVSLSQSSGYYWNQFTGSISSYGLNTVSTIGRLNYNTETISTSTKTSQNKVFPGSQASVDNNVAYVTGGSDDTFYSQVVYYYDQASSAYPYSIPGTNYGWKYTSNTSKINFGTAVESSVPSGNISVESGFMTGTETRQNATNYGYLFGGYYEPSGGPLPNPYYPQSNSHSYIHKMLYSTESYTTISNKLPTGRDSCGADGDKSTMCYIIGGYNGVGPTVSYITKFTFSTDSATPISNMSQELGDITLTSAPSSYGKAYSAGGNRSQSYTVGGWPIQPASYSNYSKIIFSTDTYSTVIGANLIAIPPANDTRNITGPGGGQGSRGYVKGVGGAANYGYFGGGWANFGWYIGPSQPNYLNIGSYNYNEIEKFEWATETNSWVPGASWSVTSFGGKGGTSFSQ